jgi:tetratricopeptide (TPR) repeat protein
VAAAKLCLIIADNTRDAPTAHHAFNLVRTEVRLTPGQSTNSLETRLIFETSFGDRETATAALDALIATAHRSTPRSKAFSLILAAHASERLGFGDRVVEIAGEAYRIAVECSCATAAAAAARKLAWSYLDEANHTLAEDWYKRAVNWVDKGQLSSFSADLYGLQAELLIGHEDYQGAEEALAKSAAAWRRTVHARWRLGVLSAHCAIWLATGQRSRCESAADEYRELLASVDAEEGNDFLVARYVRLLASVDRVEDARDELRRYLRSRKKPPTLYGAALNAVIEELAHSEAADTPISTPPYETSLRSQQQRA